MGVSDSPVSYTHLDVYKRQLPEGALCNLLDQKPEGMEIVLTGRDVPNLLKGKADLITEMKPVKHYMDKGVKARKGIEF